jgi:metallo-beta-lactamase family protein
MTRITFHGGAGTVTGSRHLLEANGSTLLVDCGMFQGLKELRLLNWEDPGFDVRAVDHMLLTHSHIDHAGYLPRLVKYGYPNDVYATPATCELAEILLLDSAKIQEEDAHYANRKKFSKHKPALPLYTSEDAQEALSRLRPVPYHEWLNLDGPMRARFANAGHILGSAHVEVQVRGMERDLTIVFSGDVGRYNMPLHPDPTPPPPCDVMLLESTYGNRDHDPTPFLEQLRAPLLRTFERRGTVLIPAFAVARAQIATLLLRQGMEAGTIPEVPIHIDSPMAVNTTRLYSKHLDDENLDPELVGEGRSRLFPHNVEFHRTVEESKRLNDLPGPRIIVSSSGMLTGGRVLHHLARLLPDPKNLLVMVGYQAAGTRGRAMLEGARSIKLHGGMVPVRAEFVDIHGLSAHADRHGLLRWVRSAEKAPSLIFIVHGEPEAALALQALIQRELKIKCVVPRLGDSFELEAMLAGQGQQ